MKPKLPLSYVAVCAFIFLFFVFAGYSFAKANPDPVAHVLQNLDRRFEPLSDYNSLLVFAYIFINNSMIDLAAILTFFLFGLVPLYLVFSNGFTIGLVISAAEKRIGPVKLAAALLPHGIIEIPTFLISAGIGLWLAVKFIRKITMDEPFKKHFLFSMKIFFFLILSLNFLAALIEVYVTPIVYSFV